MSKHRNKLPHRWSYYSAMGKVVEGTRFLPFKTPLKESLCKKYFPNTKDWFTPARVFAMAPMVKIIIDLTFTDRYYSGKEFFNYGISHVKIKCPGGGEVVPHPELLNKFNKTVQSFLKSEEGGNKETLIGVHCTHGLNRTSYFICNYMVTFNKFSPFAAFQAFETSRGHKIERLVYKIDIIRRNNLPKPKKRARKNKTPRLRECHPTPVPSSSSKLNTDLKADIDLQQQRINQTGRKQKLILTRDYKTITPATSTSNRQLSSTYHYTKMNISVSQNVSDAFATEPTDVTN